MKVTFMGRKHATTQNVLARWEDSAHDALILADALERTGGLRVPPGRCTTTYFVLLVFLLMFTLTGILGTG